MRETNWTECLESNSSKESFVDIQRAKSLYETAKERLLIFDSINVKNINFVFEDYYTSLLEILQSIIILSGFKVLNHICLGYFLRDVLNRRDLYLLFDDLRYKRNSLTYYGNRMNLKEAKNSLDKCKNLIKEFDIIYESLKF